MVDPSKSIEIIRSLQDVQEYASKQQPSVMGGIAVIESLQRAQGFASGLLSRKTQDWYIRAAVRRANMELLLGHTFIINTVPSVPIVAMSPENDLGERSVLPGPLGFLATVSSVSQLYIDTEGWDEAIAAPLDSLTVNFHDPLVFNVSNPEAEELRSFKLQVPVLSIDPGRSLEVAA